MSNWFYAKAGQQAGPVSFEELRALARSGELSPDSDLAWTSGMKEWQPSGRIDGLFASASQELMPRSDPNNPYAPPQSSWHESVVATGPLQEITPGSEPLDVGACVKRGFEITKRHFGMIMAIGLIYLAFSIGVSVLMELVDKQMGFVVASEDLTADDFYSEVVKQTGSPLNFIVTQVISIFFSLGLVRVGLNLVSGQEVSLAQLFSGGGKLLPAIAASMIYWALVLVGLIAFIFPGIYLLLRYGQFMNAMVDRNLGIIESLRYSSAITLNSRMNLFSLLFVSICMVLLGFLAFVVGLFFAYPIVWMSWMVAYRWLQYGNRAILDNQGHKH